MDKIFEKTIGILGETAYNKIKDKTICIIGLGGVGGTAFECLLRTGFQKFVIIDFDNVSATNLNRQLLFNYSDIGNDKTFCAKQHGKNINPDIDIIDLNMKISSETISVLEKYKIDFIVDAIDDVSGKIEISKYALKNNIPFVVSLGMGNKRESQRLSVVSLDKTTIDPLAKKMRYLYKQNNIDTKKVMCVFSNEMPVSSFNGVNSLMNVTSSAGLLIAEYVLNLLISIKSV